MDSMQTSTNTAKNIASAVGTVMTKATWSAMFCKGKNKGLLTLKEETPNIKHTI